MDITFDYINNSDELIITFIHIFSILFTCSLQPNFSIFGVTVYFLNFLLLFVPLYKLYWSYVKSFQTILNSSHKVSSQISCFAVSLGPNVFNNTIFCIAINPGTFC